MAGLDPFTVAYAPGFVSETIPLGHELRVHTMLGVYIRGYEFADAATFADFTIAREGQEPDYWVDEDTCEIAITGWFEPRLLHR